MPVRTLILLAAAFAIVASITSEEWDRSWDEAEKKCVDLMKFSNGDKVTFLSIDEVPRRAKCFVSCFFDEVGLTNGTEINEELYTIWLEEELKKSKNKKAIMTAVKGCIDGIERTEKCETAYRVYECLGNKYFG